MQAWEKKWPGVVTPRPGGPSATTAKALLQKAKDHARDARVLQAAGSHGSALALAEDALVNSADAVLANDGWRVKGKTGSHQARFEYPGLPAIFAANAALLGAIRNLRNIEIYGATHSVTAKQASDAIALAENVIPEVEKVIP